MTPRHLSLAAAARNQQRTFPFVRDCAHDGGRDLPWRSMHVGEYCARCGMWLRWVPQTSAALAAAPPRPNR
jgi:hypothetical protein